MRRRLYGALAALGVITGLAVVVGETVDGSCAVICDWEVALAIVGFTAMLGFAALGVVAIGYELRRARRSGVSDA